MHVKIGRSRIAGKHMSLLHCIRISIYIYIHIYKLNTVVLILIRLRAKELLILFLLTPQQLLICNPCNSYCNFLLQN